MADAWATGLPVPRARQPRRDFDGDEANVAISLPRLGVHASFVSAVPDNDFGNAARAFLGTVAAQPVSRDLPSPSLEGRRKLGIDHDGPVAMLATSPESIRFDLAEAFCRAIEQLPGISGVVRLHPSEDLASYQTMIARHPTVSFVENRRASLDEALAATDIVVVRASGFGSDALVKRKPVVVLSPGERPTGHDLDLIELAGCPHAHDSDELAAALGRMAWDPAFRAEREIAAEHFVSRFCAAFGNESADITVAAVRAVATRRESLEPISGWLDNPTRDSTADA